MKEWLPCLNTHRKWFKAHSDFKVGDTMVLSTDKAHGKWQLGQILGIIPGKDGQVPLESKTDTENCSARVYKRGGECSQEK